MISEQWPVKTLGEVISLEYGKPLPKDDRDPDGQFPVYGANGEKARSNKFYHSKPTIIVGRKGSAGELNLSEEKVNCMGLNCFDISWGRKSGVWWKSVKNFRFGWVCFG